MAYQRNSEGREGGFRRKQSGFRRRKKVCVFCGKDSEISYKDVNNDGELPRAAAPHFQLDFDADLRCGYKYG